jgi:predicted O-methyltransferase YrrM
MDFRQSLNAHFRFMGDVDNLPHGVKPRRTNQDGRTLLARMMSDLGYRVGAEIGTRYGMSAKLWCETVPGLKLTCIDPYSIYRPRKSQEKQDDTFASAQQTLAPFDVTFMRESSIKSADRFEDESLDFVHIDGDHAFDMVMQDLILYVPKVRKGGMILVHDYFNFYQGGVIKAVDAYTDCHLIRPWFTTRDLEPTAFWERGVERA